MHQRSAHQLLTYDVRLPDEAQADALRLLDASRQAINEIVELLWPSLDLFGLAHPGPAWKQLEGCKIRRETQQKSGLKCSITEVYSTVSHELWRQRGCYGIWNGQRFTT